MLIIGAGGMAKDLLSALSPAEIDKGISFYDDVCDPKDPELSIRFNFISTPHEAAYYFKHQDPRFTLGISQPTLRQQMFERFCSLGGEPTTIISESAIIGDFNVFIGAGCTILPLAIVSNASKLGKGCLVGFHACISHDCVVGDFCEIAPGAGLLGRSSIGNLTQVGALTTILPAVRLGSKCKTAAGTVVTKDVPDCKLLAGVPGRIIGPNT